MKKTLLMAAVLAVATVLAAGLTVLPSSVQEAQANPCGGSVNENENEGGEGETIVVVVVTPNSDERECKIIGNDIDFEED
jgi:hypothetical protein